MLIQGKKLGFELRVLKNPENVCLDIEKGPFFRKALGSYTIVT
jgi:hypothetical protein